MHIDAVKRSVPAGQWCGGHPRAEKPKRSWFRFGRG